MRCENENCGRPLEQPATGRRRHYCSDVCRQRTCRKRRRSAVWPPRFEEAEAALIELRRQQEIEPEAALARIVAAWVAA